MTTRQRGLLITGTDTGVGKTFVACGLAGSLRQQGFRVAPFKPAETGCEPDPKSQALVPADAELLRRATATQASIETICPYRFRAPLAPWVAAELEGASIDPQRLERCYRELSDSHDFVLVETAGGILVPLAESFHYADLARLLDLPVLVVIGSKLGAINHTLLTLEFLSNAGLRVLACVLNHPTAEAGPAIETNERTLRRLVQQPIYVIPYDPGGQQPWEQKGFDALASHVGTGLQACTD
ncbi:MAG: dethiobiotin synthase [Acidobacteria bacterium RIFCSPLOWO2_12_FULL_60_22]|nr:MAG: dethiobiotin synthase [Acidobacteria bacterium RIFCSPLOWO2_12_FULL_60_22]